MNTIIGLAVLGLLAMIVYATIWGEDGINKTGTDWIDQLRIENEKKRQAAEHSDAAGKSGL